MKKIILILALALGVNVNAQIVGGFVPINSTKSFTAGNSTFSNVIARGTLSVGSTASVTGNALFSSSVGIGALPTSSLSKVRITHGTGILDFGEALSGYGAVWLNKATPTSTNYLFITDANTSYVNCPINFQFLVNGVAKHNMTSTGMRIGGSTNPVAALDVMGTMSVSSTATIAGALTAQSTMSLGSGLLTGGNSGTVAVLSDAVFPVNFVSTSGTNLNDATTYYFGNTGWSYNTNNLQGIVTLPYNCTLVSWNYSNLVLGALGTSESGTLQVAGTTTLNLSSVITLSAATSNYTGTVNTNFNAGDQINIKFITPTYATNPTTLLSGLVLWFVRRT